MVICSKILIYYLLKIGFIIYNCFFEISYFHHINIILYFQLWNHSGLLIWLTIVNADLEKYPKKRLYIVYKRVLFAAKNIYCHKHLRACLALRSWKLILVFFDCKIKVNNECLPGKIVVVLVYYVVANWNVWLKYAGLCL